MVQLLSHFGKRSKLNRITTRITTRYPEKMESKDSSRY